MGQVYSTVKELCAWAGYKTYILQKWISTGGLCSDWREQGETMLNAKNRIELNRIDTFYCHWTTVQQNVVLLSD